MSLKCIIDCVPLAFAVVQFPHVLLQLKELSGELSPEPLLTPNDQRFVLFPIKHHDVSCQGACSRVIDWQIVPQLSNSARAQRRTFLSIADLGHVQEG